MIKKLDEAFAVIKKWGKEEILYNEDICLKRMVLHRSTRCSLHFHKVKKEIFFIENGHMTIDWIDTQSGTLFTECVAPGGVILVEPGTPHRFYTTTEKCVFWEFSTHHEDSDSYRITPSEAQ